MSLQFAFVLAPKEAINRADLNDAFSSLCGVGLLECIVALPAIKHVLSSYAIGLLIFDYRDALRTVVSCAPHVPKTRSRRVQEHNRRVRRHRERRAGRLLVLDRAVVNFWCPGENIACGEELDEVLDGLGG